MSAGPQDARQGAGTARAGDPVARLRGVSQRYGAVTALDDVTLDIPAGRMVGLIGPDGVGKSTLLGLVAGVRRIQSGEVTALGGDMARGAHRNRVAARIAYMPQGLGRNLYPTLSVRENIDFFGRLYGQSAAERAARIDDLLASTGLAPFPDRPAGKLSGGMKQKLSLCCALIHDPDLLILDEPTTGVDPLSRRQFWDLIARIRGRRPQMSVITATAYMSEAEEFEELVAMDAGRILATGTPAELRARTGCDTLEAAFISLLPEEARRSHRAITLPPRSEAGGPPAIDARNLSMRFGNFTAVDDVSFRIERGEIFGFLGSNGCGKTTTMKMLTGLLTPSEGAAELFGRKVESDDLETRRRVGYMSQSFSLYSELSVRQNLSLHADLFDVPRADRGARIDELLARFELGPVADSRPAGLPLGMRQRLQLAVAVLHRPEILILDEPTSGVDPVARDGFWELLIDLSRKDGVTIFISTHFMNEAERCDRISLMHAGKVLAAGTPEELRVQRGSDTLEEAFIAWLAEAAGPAPAGDDTPEALDAALADGAGTGAHGAPVGLFSPGRTWAFGRREALELTRDPIRLAFALLGPIILMLAIGFGISFDVENLSYAVLDEDRTPESRLFLEQFSSSRYFDEQARIGSYAELDRRLRAGDIGMALVIPPDYGRDLLAGHRPEIAVWLDGSVANRAETARGYVEAVYADYLHLLNTLRTGTAGELYPAGIETRFRYNQSFRSDKAIPPGALMLLLIIVPSMMTALAVVREKELGSISNLYAAPARRIEFLIGKQIPYVAVAMASFATLVVTMRLAFGLSPGGDLLALSVGALFYVAAATAFGLVISTFVTSQIAAVFGSAIIVLIPTLNFSGMLYPVATLDGAARLVGEAFPPYYFNKIASGVFNKGLGLAELWPNYLAILGFLVAFWALASLLLRKQEA